MESGFVTGGHGRSQKWLALFLVQGLVIVAGRYSQHGPDGLAETMKELREGLWSNPAYKPGSEPLRQMENNNCHANRGTGGPNSCKSKDNTSKQGRFEDALQRRSQRLKVDKLLTLFLDSTYDEEPPRFLGKHEFQTVAIPEMNSQSRHLGQLLAQGRPAVIKKATTGGGGRRFWSRMPGVVEHFPFGNMTLATSDSRFFLQSRSPNLGCFDWDSPVQERPDEGIQSFANFMTLAQEMNEAANSSRVRLVGEIDPDFLNLIASADHSPALGNKYWLVPEKSIPEFWSKQLESITLAADMPGAVSWPQFIWKPRFIAQLTGSMRVYLFDPKQHNGLYLFPVSHPAGMHSQVNFDFPDHEAYPRFKDILAYSTVVSSPDAIFVPAGWAMYTETELGRAGVFVELVADFVNQLAMDEEDGEPPSTNSEETPKTANQSSPKELEDPEMELERPRNDALKLIASLPPDAYMRKDIFMVALRDLLERNIQDTFPGSAMSKFIRDGRFFKFVESALDVNRFRYIPTVSAEECELRKNDFIRKHLSIFV